MAIEMKRCKVYPRNGLQFIPGILEKQKRIEFPAELPLSPHEIRRCLSYADVYEVRGEEDCVLLTLENYLTDNTDAVAATDVPEVELLYPRDEDAEEESVETATSQGTARVAPTTPPVTEQVEDAAAKVKTTTQANTYKSNKNRNNTYNKTATTETKEDNATAEESK